MSLAESVSRAFSVTPTRHPPAGGSPAMARSPPRSTRTPHPRAVAMSSAARSAHSALAVARGRGRRRRDLDGRGGLVDEHALPARCRRAGRGRGAAPSVGELVEVPVVAELDQRGADGGSTAPLVAAAASRATLTASMSVEPTTTGPLPATRVEAAQVRVGAEAAGCRVKALDLCAQHRPRHLEPPAGRTASVTVVPQTRQWLKPSEGVGGVVRRATGAPCWWSGSW